jgi:hypothetical protein
MRSGSRFLATGAQTFIGLALGGCARHTAPTLSLFGAYFPIWILCGILGVLAAAGARLLLVATGFSSVVPAQLMVCTAAGVIVACLAWLWLGQ